MHTLGISPDGKTLWHHAKVQGLAAYVPSPVAFDKWFFLVTDSGNASCLDAKTGAPVWSQRLCKHHFPSTVLAGRNAQSLSDEGIRHLLQASANYLLIYRNGLCTDRDISPVIYQRL